LIVAPGLVLTARHCLMKRKTIETLCNPDGSPQNIADPADLRPESVDQISVSIGSQKPGLRTVAVRDIVTVLDVTICRSDLAFLVLGEPGLDVRLPLRRTPVHSGEVLTVTGWGYTSDAAVDAGLGALPAQRYTLDHLPVTDVGPGLIPAGDFAT